MTASRPKVVAEPTPATGSKEWHEQRRTGIGGSDIAAFAGLSPYTTPDEAWLEKTGEIPPADLSGNAAVRWGSRLEAVIADAYAEEQNVRVERVNRTLRRQDKPWMMAHLDRRIVGASEGLEIKAFGLHNLGTGEWGESGSTQIAPYVAAQVGWYLAVTGWDRFWLAVLFGGQDLRLYVVERDIELLSKLEEIGERAWGWVERRERPPILSVADARRRWPNSLGASVIATPEIQLAERTLRDASAQLKIIEAERDELQAQIMAYMGDADTLVATDTKTRLRTWKTQSATRIDVERFRAEQPDNAAFFSVTSESRVFREVKQK